MAAHPFQAAGQVLTDAVADALWYVPDKVIDHLVSTGAPTGRPPPRG
ncbi:hypothetical protein [Streptomyces sp. NRRL S-646]|nr:hypothetical protein [Streptomyces sp. NRRL S-646]